MDRVMMMPFVWLSVTKALVDTADIFLTFEIVYAGVVNVV